MISQIRGHCQCSALLLEAKWMSTRQHKIVSMQKKTFLFRSRDWGPNYAFIFLAMLFMVPLHLFLVCPWQRCGVLLNCHFSVVCINASLFAHRLCCWWCQSLRVFWAVVESLTVLVLLVFLFCTVLFESIHHISWRIYLASVQDWRCVCRGLQVLVVAGRTQCEVISWLLILHTWVIPIRTLRNNRP